MAGQGKAMQKSQDTPSVVWFEVVGKDGAKLRSFFSSLFGWQIAESGTGMDYGLVAATNGGIGGGIGRSQDDAFFPRQRRPRIEQRFAVAPGPVEEDDERRRFGLLRRFRNKQVIGPGPASGTECFLRSLVCRRRREQ